MKNLLLLVTTVIAVVALVGAYQARYDANKAQRHLCAWVFYEDGSASVRRDDISRFKCMEDADK